MGAILCAKMQFQAKICKFYFKITAKLVNFLIRTKRAKICNFYTKFDTKSGKKGTLGVDSGKKEGHWV